MRASQMIRWLSLPGFGLTGLPLEKHYNHSGAMGYADIDRTRGPTWAVR